jgi:hypothetical protein
MVGKGELLVRTSVVNVDGARVAYRLNGQGPAVVLANGTAALDMHWGPVIAELGKQRTVISLDYSGSGDTTDDLSAETCRPSEGSGRRAGQGSCRAKQGTTAAVGHAAGRRRSADHRSQCDVPAAVWRADYVWRTQGLRPCAICEILGGAITGGGTMRPENQASGTATNGMLTFVVDPSRLVDSGWLPAGSRQ